MFVLLNSHGPSIAVNLRLPDLGPRQNKKLPDRPTPVREASGSKAIDVALLPLPCFTHSTLIYRECKRNLLVGAHQGTPLVIASDQGERGKLRFWERVFVGMRLLRSLRSLAMTK